jgi:hypothetical protein
MSHEPIGVPKVHPATREVLPEDPMELHAFEVPGDTDLMLRLLVEEYARIGCSSDDIMRLARDPNYTVFYGLARLLGEAPLRRRVQEILSRCGVMRVKAKLAPPEEAPGVNELVQIDLAS